MKILVVYDTVFGNTEKIAQAMVPALSAKGEVTLVKAADVSPQQLKEAEIVVAGSPTRGFRPSEGMQKFLKSLPEKALLGKRVAGFDTRLDVRRVNNALLTILEKIFGYAAEPISKTLVRKGGTQAVSPAGFIVLESEGPVLETELARAAEWAGKIL